MTSIVPEMDDVAELEGVEPHLNESANEEPMNHECKDSDKKKPKRSTLKTVCVLAAFNVLLFSILGLFFKLIDVLHEMDRPDILHSLYSAGGLLSIALLWKVGEIVG